nr:unnamed protein product [uncultured bacterium]
MVRQKANKLFGGCSYVVRFSRSRLRCRCSRSRRCSRSPSVAALPLRPFRSSVVLACWLRSVGSLVFGAWRSVRLALRCCFLVAVRPFRLVGLRRPSCCCCSPFGRASVGVGVGLPSALIPQQKRKSR